MGSGDLGVSQAAATTSISHGASVMTSSDGNATTVTPVLAILYGRFSPKPTFRESMDSIEVQEEICRRYAASKGIEIAVVLRDPLVSARRVTLFERPEGSKIPGLVADGIQHVIAVRLDRIFRNATDGMVVLEQWHEQEVSLHLADQGGCSINCGSATGRLLARTLLSFAEFEPDLIGERTSAAMLSKQARGLRMTSENTIPIGFEIDPDSPVNERGKLTGLRPSEDERKVVECAREIFLSSGSLSKTALALNDLGVTLRGKQFDHAKVKRCVESCF